MLLNYTIPEVLDTIEHTDIIVQNHIKFGLQLLLDKFKLQLRQKYDTMHTIWNKLKVNRTNSIARNKSTWRKQIYLAGTNRKTWGQIEKRGNKSLI